METIITKKGCLVGCFAGMKTHKDGATAFFLTTTGEVSVTADYALFLALAELDPGTMVRLTDAGSVEEDESP
jgi:hypothetical protein